MKKLMLLVLTAMFTIGLVSCENGDQQKKNETPKKYPYKKQQEQERPRHW